MDLRENIFRCIKIYYIYTLRPPNVRWRPSVEAIRQRSRQLRKKKKKKDSLVRDFQALTFDLTLRKEAGVQA